MTKEDNIFFAKRKLIDNIYKSANLEGIAVTFADTVDFINNVNTGKISVDDMLKRCLGICFRNYWWRINNWLYKKNSFWNMQRREC